MRFYYLDVSLMERFCHAFALRLFNTDQDPIAAFSEHDLAKLDSALNNPRQTFGGKDLYPAFADKAAILWYSLNKNHPFPNGNKRISTASVLVFMYINGYWIDVPINEMVDKALYIATSQAEDKEGVLRDLGVWISANLKPEIESTGIRVKISG